MSVETIDKSTWPAGPWMDEPDHEVFEFKGIRCAIVRNSLGALCGYAAMPAGHPHHGREYNDLYDLGYEAHGGLTYSRSSVYGVEDDGSWWVGFDCAHLYDIVPNMRRFTDDPMSSYKDIDFVREECKCLATRIADQMQGGAS